MLYGSITNDDQLVGIGKALAKDDIKDMPDWLNFEDGRNFTTGYA